MANEIFDSLDDVNQGKVKGIVSSIKEHLMVDGLVDVELIMAVLEQLNEVKKEAREAYKEIEKKESEERKEKQTELAKDYISTLKLGDMITFVYGPASYQKQATLPLEKVGAATVQVTYTPDMITGKSVTSKRNIRYDKIIVPEDFSN